MNWTRNVPERLEHGTEVYMKAKKENNSTKISVILTPENYEKMQEVVKNTGMTKTDFINRACDECTVVGIAETADLAAEFAKLRDALGDENCNEEARKAGDKVCQSFALLVEKITKL